MLQSSLRSQGIERRVQLELPGFLGLSAIVSSTDLIATVPRTIGETLARMGPIKVFACPVKVPAFTVKQYWHVRYHHDPGLRWLRGAVCAAARPRRAAAAASRGPKMSARGRDATPGPHEQARSPATSCHCPMRPTRLHRTP